MRGYVFGAIIMCTLCNCKKNGTYVIQWSRFLSNQIGVSEMEVTYFTLFIIICSHLNKLFR